MHKLPLVIICFAIFLSSPFLAGCAGKTPAELSATDFILGTACTIRVLQGGDKAAFARLHQLEDELTVNKAGSQIDAVNAAAGIGPAVVGKDAMAIIAKGLRY
ncbi:MAG: hypothetical protein Q8O15_07840 [Rectinemataceae bacterium]|nr:hypothetical protein [Rectinemataceae bacterium]